MQGCNFDDSLCDKDETCIADGLFGQCYSDAESEILKPLILSEPLNDPQRELLRLELTRLANNGLDWPHARSQCVLAYFKLSTSFALDYDTEFCSVRNPNNVWELIQRVQNVLANEEEEAMGIESVIQEALNSPEETNVAVIDDGEGGVELKPFDSEQPNEPEENVAQVLVPVVLLNDKAAGDEELYEIVEPEHKETQMDSPLLARELKAKTESEAEAEKRSSVVNPKFQSMVPKGEVKPSQAAEDGKQSEIDYIKTLSPEQMEQLEGFIEALQNTLTNDKEEAETQEIEEIIPLTSENNEQQLLLKKDAEKFSSVDMGLSNTVHKIVKGGIQRVEGNRIYLKVAKDNLTETELYKLIAYLDQKIAEPNNLYFDEFLYENGQLSFRASKLDFLPKKQRSLEKSKKDEAGKDNMEYASGVAQAVYKRRKDIQTLAGVEVDETGIGSGVDVVPVEKFQRDMLFIPILAICALTITTLISVLAVHLYKNRKNSRSNLMQGRLPEVINSLEGKTAGVYEELCRQRMSGQDVPISVRIGGPSKHSSTSSWPDENLLQSSNLDISTGHVLLSFLQDCLDKPDEISDQWSQLANYTNKSASVAIAYEKENIAKNFDINVLPYDDSLVTLNQRDREQTSNYINASKIYDSDPQQVAYIATQQPLQNTVDDFWQMIWDQGVAIIVNLSNQEDQKNEKWIKYWPEEGAKTFGIFEIHLVSEHIWSEDYVVRSLYLKNLKTNETRTVTQFHYLTWPEASVPDTIKSLLEFRRKINKSYRGRVSPIVVHCTNGAGRTGTYCLLDIVSNRILKGVKELNIAGSLEHLRDQRMGMVENEAQYKLVFNCVAGETSSILKNLQQN